MKKKTVVLKDLGKAHVKSHLKMFFPFLRKEFRPILRTELKNKEVLKELFGENETDLNKLNTIYEYQR